MRKELFQALRQALLRPEVGVAHVDLWNHNIEFVDQEEPWERPAVFVEYEPIRWHSVVTGISLTAECRVRLHIVTDFDPSDPFRCFDTEERVRAAVTALDGDTFSALELAETHTNHDHEHLVESIDVFDFAARIRGPLAR